MDSTLRDWVIAHRNGTLTQVMRDATWFGSTLVLIVFVVVAAALLVWRGRRGDALLVVCGSAGVFVLGPILKLIFGRVRPPVNQHLVHVDSLAFPSGHSLNSMAVLGLLTVLAVRGRSALPRALIVALGVLLVLLVGFSRVYLGVHWPTDVLGGWAFGVLWIVMCLLVARRIRGNSASSGTVQRGS